jgi:hypothetical protein
MVNELAANLGHRVELQVTWGCDRLGVLGLGT